MVVFCLVCDTGFERDKGTQERRQALQTPKTLLHPGHKFKTKLPVGLEDIAGNLEEGEVLLAGQHLGLQDVAGC